MSLLAKSNPWWSDRSARLPIYRSRHRDLATVVADLVRKESRRAILIRGPRQVGKSVLLSQLVDLVDEGWPAARVVYVDFSDPEVDVAGLTPEAVVRKVGAEPAGPPYLFLFDEIARIDRWDLWLKKSVDDTGHRYVATDSSAHLLRGARESGQGRWLDLPMETLVFREFVRLAYGDDVGPADVAAEALPRYLARGGFPEHLGADSEREVWRLLRSDIAEKAVQAELLRSNVDVLRASRLFGYLVKRSGSILVVSRVAKDLGADQRAVGNWVQLLLNLMLLQRLDGSTGATRASLRTHPKIYAADHGLVAAFADSADPLQDPDVVGPLYETMVFRHLRELVRARQGAVRFFRRDRGGELDFVVSVGGSEVGVEATASRSPSGTKVIQARRSGDAAGVERVVLIHGGIERADRSGVALLPIVEFVSDPGSILEEAK